MHEGETFAKRHAEVVHEFEWCRAGAAFLAVDDDEVRRDPDRQHCLDHGEKLPRMTDPELEAGWLAAAATERLSHDCNIPVLSFPGELKR
jgi:hypothetical protein